MSRIPIRIRLTLAFVLALGVVLAGLGLVVYTRFENSLDRNTDRALRSRATDITAVIERSGPRLSSPGAQRFIESDESFAQILDGDGHVVDGSRLVSSRPLLTEDELGRARDGSLTLDRDGAIEEGDPARLFAVPVGDLVLVVGQDREDDEEAQATLRLLLGVGLPIALLLASIAGYAVAAAALRPVEAMRAKAAEVSVDRPGEQLPLGPADDEIRRLGETLNAMLARLEDALERERGFVADASHELRTPLAAIRGYTELAQRKRDALPDDVAHAMSRVESETERMTQLVEDMLLLARLDTGRPLEREQVDLSRLVVDAVSDAHIAGPDHQWSLDLPDEPVVVTGDEARLHQVLANLLANARTHTPPGTSVTTSLAPDESGGAVLTVGDDGPGIPAWLQPEIFERFARGDSSRSRRGGSTGLGLAIVAAVVRAHNGTIGVHSVPGKTEFVVTFPGSSQPSHSPAKTGA
jgi:two-component system, OmpR family, sensor kinase